MSHLSALDADVVVEQGKAHQALIKRIVEEVFHKDIHYGAATGREGDRAALLKPGADDAIQLLTLEPHYIVMKAHGDGRSEPSFSAVIRCDLKTPDGVLVASGLGAANTWEKKWRYRKAEIVCPKCDQPAVIKGREEYGGGWLCFKKKGGCGAKFAAEDAFALGEKEENPDPWDLQNSVTKYAKKRAQTDAVLGLGFSAYFTQDMPGGATPGSQTPVTPQAPEKEADPMPEDLAGEVKMEAERVAKAKGWTFADTLKAASTFDGGDGKAHFITPASLGRASAKWLTTTLTKLKKISTEARLASAVPPGDSPF